MTNIPEEETLESSEGDLLTELTASASPTLESAAILSAMDGMSKKTVERFNSFEASLRASQATLTQHAPHPYAVEVMASDHDNRLAALELQAKHLRDANKTLQDKAPFWLSGFCDVTKGTDTKRSAKVMESNGFSRRL